MPPRLAPSLRSSDTPSLPTQKLPISLPKRLLFPHLPSGAEIPSLLSIDDHDLNSELYDFLALALRAFVVPWWSKISRYDKEFLPEITRIIALVLRSLEARLAVADVPSLVFKEVPTILAQHYIDYRNAATKVGSAYATGGASTLPQLFHQLQPHMAISSEGCWNETYLRQAVDHVLKSCLPPQDWNAQVERTIIREILTKVVMDAVFSKLSQPWFIHKIMLDLLGSFSSPKPSGFPPPQPKRFSWQFFIVFILSAVQTLSGFCLAAIAFNQRMLRTIRVIHSSTPLVNDPHRANLAYPILHLAEIILTMRARAAASSLFSLLELCAGFSRTFLDRALPYMLLRHGLSPPRLTRVVLLSKRALFPTGYPSPPTPDPAPEEQIILKERLEARLLTLFPGVSASLLLGPDSDTQRQTISNMLDPLSSPECNVHLLLFLLDAILLALFPELGVLSGTPNHAGDDPDDTLMI